MGLWHRTVTLTAAAQTVKAAAGLDDKDDVPLNSLTFQEDAGNGNVCFVGDSNLTSSVYMLKLPAGANGLGPVVLEPMRPVKPSEIYVLGTAGQKLHVGGVIV